MTSLYEAWLTANPKMMADNSRWKHFIEAHPDISDRWEEFSNHYQRIHFPDLWKTQSKKNNYFPEEKTTQKKIPASKISPNVLFS
jgi:hypothetical protein